MALTFPREPAVEAYLGEWTDVTEQLSQTVPLVVTRGGASEQPEATPGSFTCTMRNETGNWTVDNPLGAYFGLLGRNTPIRYLLPFLEDAFTRSVVDGLGSTPDGQAWTLDGTAADFDVNGSAATILIAGPAATIRNAYLADLSAWSDYEITCDVLIPHPSAAANSAGIIVRGSTTADAWRVSLTLAISGAVTLGIFDGSGTLGPGSYNVDTLTAGTYRLRVLVEGDSIRGKTWPVAEAEPLDWQIDYTATTDLNAAGWAGIRARTGVGATNTTFTYDNFTVRIPRFCGEITSITPGWDESHRAKWADIQAGGLFMRLGQGTTPNRSAPRQFIEKSAPAPAHYWPLEESALANRGAPLFGSTSALIDVSTAALYGIRPETAWGAEPLAPWLPPGPQVRNLAALAATLTMTPTSSWAVDFLVKFGGSKPSVGTSYEMQFRLADGIKWAVRFHTDTVPVDPTLSIQLVTDGYVTPSTATELPMDGTVHHYRLRVQASGADCVGTVWLDGVQVLNATRAALTFSRPVSYKMFSSANDPDTTLTFGHVAFYSDASPPSETLAAEATFGHVGETAGRRAERLADENGLAFSARGDLDATARMGPQGNRALMELLQECADADQGALLEIRGASGLMFVAVNALYSQTPTVTLDYSAKQIQPGLKVRPDDKGTRNDITAERLHGGKYQAQQLVGPLNVENPGASTGAVGRYDDSLTVNVETDEQLADVAYWQLHLGTNPESRCPAVEVELAANGITPTLEANLLRANLGDKIVVENLTDINIYQPLTQIIRGYTETLDRKRSHRIFFNTTPATPYDVFELETSGYDRLDTEGCVLAVAIDDNDTALSPATTSGPLWTTDAGDFPMTAFIGGEEITVTDCDNEVITYGTVGTAAHADNASVTPGLPSGHAAGNLILVFAAIRNTAGTPTTPSGYTLLANMGNARLFGKIHSGSLTAPAISFTGGSAGDTTSAQMIRLAGAFHDIENLVLAKASALNASAQNVAYPGLSLTGLEAPAPNCFVLYLAWKQDDYTSVTSPGTEIAEASTTTGNDQSLTWAYQIQTTPTNIAAGSFTVTGGATAVSIGAVVALRCDRQAWTVTRSGNGVAKSHAVGAEITLPPVVIAL